MAQLNAKIDEKRPAKIILYQENGPNQTVLKIILNSCELKYKLLQHIAYLTNLTLANILFLHPKTLFRRKKLSLNKEL